VSLVAVKFKRILAHFSSFAVIGKVSVFARAPVLLILNAMFGLGSVFGCCGLLVL
jgi:hypothetical protein